MLHHPCIPRGAQRQAPGAKSEVATSPLPPQVPKRGRKPYVTPAFSGIPNAKRREQNQKWSPTKGNKIRTGCLSLAFSGAQKRVEMLRHPCILKGVPNAKCGEQNHKWLPHSCLLGGPKEAGNAMSPLHSQGSPTPSAGRKIRSGLQQRGTKSELAASLLPSRGPKTGRKYYVTPALSGIPNKGEQNQKWLPHPCLLGGPKDGGIWT